MKTKQMTEDYMKTIYILSREGDVRCFQLADSLSVSRPTVSISLKTLAEDGLVYFEKKAVHLTAEGLKIAKAVEERYQVLYRFLINLGVSAETASRDACIQLAPAGSTPITRIWGFKSLAKVDTPVASPPPPTGTRI